MMIKALVAVTRARIFAGARSRGSAWRRRTPRLNKQAALVPMSLFLLGISTNGGPAEPEPEPAVPLQTGEAPRVHGRVHGLPPLLGVVRVRERRFPEVAAGGTKFGLVPPALCVLSVGVRFWGVSGFPLQDRGQRLGAAAASLWRHRTFRTQLLLRKYNKEFGSSQSEYW